MQILDRILIRNNFKKNMTHKTNICFVANFSYTFLFHELAEKLKKENLNTFWIVNNQKLYDYLKERYDDEKILYISRTDFEGKAKPVSDFKLNELIYGDRVLRYEPQKGLNFLTNIQKTIYDFFKKNGIKMVMGEVTWAHEALIHRLCKKCTELDCTYISPHVVRIPEGRFAFFTDERKSQILEFWNDVPCDKPIKARKPDYLKINDKKIKKISSVSGRLERVRRFFTNENMEPQDPTLIVNRQWRFKSRTREELNRALYKNVKRTPFTHSKEPYIFLGLHKQPEASVDICGRYYEDQLQNIKNLWRALPYGWVLLVKEHTNAIGDRSPDFYKQIQAFPNVVLVDETANSYDIIRNAKLVATVTGTIAYEAALMSIPSVTFAPVFFNKINSCRQITLEDLSNLELDKLAEDLRQSPDNRLEFSQFLMQNSFEGKFYDPQTTETSLNPENIDKISFAVARAVEKLAEKAMAAK
jgi:hypothetical protein